VGRLRLVLDGIHPKTNRTRSKLERAFLAMCSRAAIPDPEVNVMLDVRSETLEVDFFWRDAGLIVEADSRQFHNTDSAFQTDRERDQQLQLAGWRVTRCTWHQVEHSPQALAATIQGLLALR
jgi:very-short-patch-repair endonuclease